MKCHVDENAEVSSLTALKPRSKKWHLEPVSLTKISKKDQDAREPHTVSENVVEYIFLKILSTINKSLG